MTKNIGSISGDGTAIGNGNTVIVDKSRITHHHGQRPSGGHGSGGEMLGFGFLTILALIGASYFFALHAEEFYMVALAVAGSQTWLSFSSVGITIWAKQPIKWRNLVTVGLTAAATAIVGFGWHAYPNELAQLAQAATTSRAFWCGLTDYGHAVALKHFLGATVCSFGLLLLLPHSVTMFCQHLIQKGSFVERLASRFSSTGSLVTAAIALAVTFALLNFVDSYIELETAKLAPLICPSSMR
jgi:hypothetical protein